jgi:hypothetical protein
MKKILVFVDKSPLNHCSFFVSDSVSIVFDISVFSVARGHVHRSNIVRVTETRRESSSNGVKIVRIPAPLTDLNTNTFFKNRGRNGVFHSDSFLLPISDRRSFAPIPRDKVVIHLMNQVYSKDIAEPHTKRTIAIYGVFLEISVHFVGVSNIKKLNTVETETVTGVDFGINTE